MALVNWSTQNSVSIIYRGDEGPLSNGRGKVGFWPDWTVTFCSRVFELRNQGTPMGGQREREVGHLILSGAELAEIRQYASTRTGTSAVARSGATCRNATDNLANLFQDQGDIARARQTYQEAIDILKAALGENHPTYAMALNNLSDLYRSQGDCEKAESFSVQATEILKRSLGEEHPDYALALCNLGRVYVKKSDFAQAEPLLQKSSEILKQAVGEDHPNYASSRLHLGELYYARAEYKQAEKLIEEALTIDEKALGSNTQNSLTCSRLIRHCFAKPIERPRPPQSMSALNKYERIESH